MIEIRCCRCQEVFGLSDETYRTLKRSTAEFHCPWGHTQHFPLGPSEADKLRQERDRLKQRLAQRDDEIKDAEARADHERARAAGYKGQARKLAKRAAAGVCPCCNRSFANMAEHMAKQHPQFRSEHNG